MKKSKYIIDFIYSFLGVAVLNGIIQLIVNPFLERQLGAREFGFILSMISLASLMASTFGSAANYSRVISSRKRNIVNGDYNIFIISVAILSVPIAFVFLYTNTKVHLSQYITLWLIIVLTIIRYYADVEYRLKINYREFFLYYLSIALGYVLGIILFSATGFWGWIFIIGEMSGMIFVWINGTIFKRPLFKISNEIYENIKSIFVLSISYLLASIPLNADRIILQYIEGGYGVTIFYVATLGGKIISLASMPLNGVIIGHLSKSNKKISKKQFILLGVLSIGVCLVGNVILSLFSRVFVFYAYPDICDDVNSLLYIANLGQVLYFVSTVFTVILLNYTKEKYQLIINSVYLCLFLVLGINFIIVWGMRGFAFAILISNFVRLLLALYIGYKEI